MKDRELDALIAEHLFGEKPNVDFGTWEAHAPSDIYQLDSHMYRRCPRCGEERQTCCGGDREPQWCFKHPAPRSSTGDGMLAVVEAMRSRGLEFSLLRAQPKFHRWVCVLSRVHPTMGGPNQWSGDDAQSAPRAVCLAALRALGVPSAPAAPEGS